MHSRITDAALASALTALLAVACTTVDTSLTEPAASKCQLSLAAAPASFGPGGGTGSVTIATTRDCTWSITGVPAWVSIAVDRSGQGEAVIPYAVASNPAPAPRSGSIAVGGESVQLVQEAAPCRFELNRSEENVSAAGGQIAVQVTTLTGCNWSAESNVPWVSVSSGSGGNASASVGLKVAANSGADRVGTVAIGGQTFTIRQSGPGQTAPQPPAPTPPPTTLIEIEGRTKNVKGRCPNLSFSLADRTVETSAATAFENLTCRDLEKRDQDVRVTGTGQADGTIDATLVQKTGGGGEP